jgi:hypothetical protein
MYAIIDLHQIDDTNTAHNSGDAATSFWTDIAPVFKDYSNVIYELFNEPINSSMPWATFKTQVQTWIDTVRAAALNNIIIVPSMSWDQHPGDAASSPPTGTNLAYTAHIYPNNWSASFPEAARHRHGGGTSVHHRMGLLLAADCCELGNRLPDDCGWRWRQLDCVGDRQFLGTGDVFKQCADHDDRLWHPGEELAGSQGEPRLGPVGSPNAELGGLAPPSAKWKGGLVEVKKRREWAPTLMSRHIRVSTRESSSGVSCPEFSKCSRYFAGCSSVAAAAALARK